MSQKIKPIEELKDIPGFMRLDWFGGVSQSAYDDSNPLIHLFLSPVTPTPDAVKPKKMRWPSNHNCQEHVTVSAGLLPYLSMGQYFQGGRHAPLNEWPRSETISFEIDTSKSESVISHSLADKIDGDHYWVSHKVVGHHNWDLAKNSKFKLLRGSMLSKKLDGEGVERKPLDVIINDMELIRYYYANSEKLCKAIFLGDFQQDKITKKVVNTVYEKPYFDDKLKSGRFVYHHGFKREDAPIIGRILFAPEFQAMKAVWQITKSITKSIVNLDEVNLGYPTTSFPFSGKTKLTLVGKWLPPRNGRYPFLAYRIYDCTYPFPFRELSFCDAIDPRGEKAPEDAPVAFPGANKIHDGPGDNPDAKSEIGATKSNERPDAASMGLHVQLMDRAYSGLKDVVLINKKEHPCTHQSENKIQNELNNLLNSSTGDGQSGESSSERMTIRHRTVRPSLIDRDLETFIDALKALRIVKPTWKIKTLQFMNAELVEEGEWVSFFPQLRCHGRTSSLRQFSFHDEEKTIQRRFVCCEIAVENRFGYIFDAESRRRISRDETSESNNSLSILFLRRMGFEKCYSVDFKEMIMATVHNGGWPPVDKLKGFFRDRTVHGAGIQSVEGLASRLERLIVRALDLDVE